MHGITTIEKEAIQNILRALAPLGEISFPLIRTFLSIAVDEGHPQSVYAYAAGMHRYVISRHIHALGDRARDGGPGLGLVHLEHHPDNTHTHQVYLTAKGCALAAKVFRNLRNVA